MYHYIKRCFHKDEYHDKSIDSLLQAYVKCSPISLHSEGGQIVLYYLEQYKYKYEDFLTYKKKELQTCEKNINSLFNIRDSINGLADILTQCNEIKGEGEYCNFLLEGVKINIHIPKELRKNITGSIADIEKLSQRANLCYNISSNNLGIRYGVWGIIFGVVGIFVSVFFGVWSCRERPNHSDILHRMDSLRFEKSKESVKIYQTDSACQDTQILATDSICNVKRIPSSVQIGQKK